VSATFLSTGSGEGQDLYRQVVGGEGELVGENEVLVTASGDQTFPAAAGGNASGSYLLAWQDGRAGPEAIYTRLLSPVATTVIEYEYDPLYRLVEAQLHRGEL